MYEDNHISNSGVIRNSFKNAKDLCKARLLLLKLLSLSLLSSKKPKYSSSS